MRSMYPVYLDSKGKISAIASLVGLWRCSSINGHFGLLFFLLVTVELVISIWWTVGLLVLGSDALLLRRHHVCSIF